MLLDQILSVQEVQELFAEGAIYVANSTWPLQVVITNNQLRVDNIIYENRPFEEIQADDIMVNCLSHQGTWYRCNKYGIPMPDHTPHYKLPNAIQELNYGCLDHREYENTTFEDLFEYRGCYSDVNMVKVL
jgi:hypothetical protein